ncbi:MAG: VOC family protein [Hyphomonadaceae bacterium]|nr:VOC family protein [Hyphomonadaceae bacterium]
MDNPIRYVEIPVTDMARAIAFYERVFDLDLERDIVDGYEMALFPLADGPGATAALAKGDVYIPSKTGTIPYIRVGDIETALERALAAGGSVLYPRKAIGAQGFVAEIEDSEGNRIALHQE